MQAIVRDAPTLYAHAIAIEREAADRYAEFAQRMTDLGHGDVAAVCSALSGYEKTHLDELQARAAALQLPQIPAGAYAWLDAHAPETAARELVFKLLTPRQVLAIALEAERRAHRFFFEVRNYAKDPALRALAGDMMADEQHHLDLVQRALERAPADHVDWETLFGA